MRDAEIQQRRVYVLFYYRAVKCLLARRVTRVDYKVNSPADRFAVST